MYFREDAASVTFTLERQPEHQQEKPVFVVEEPGRDRWSRKVEFLLSSFGFCVGYGNIWRFPYMCLRNGGGECIAIYGEGEFAGSFFPCDNIILVGGKLSMSQENFGGDTVMRNQSMNHCQRRDQSISQSINQSISPASSQSYKMSVSFIMVSVCGYFVGAFLFPYFVFLLFGGVPIFFLEQCVGQLTQSAPVHAWNKLCPLLRGNAVFQLIGPNRWSSKNKIRKRISCSGQFFCSWRCPTSLLCF